LEGTVFEPVEGPNAEAIAAITACLSQGRLTGPERICVEGYLKLLQGTPAMGPSWDMSLQERFRCDRLTDCFREGDEDEDDESAAVLQESNNSPESAARAGGRGAGPMQEFAQDDSRMRMLGAQMFLLKVEPLLPYMDACKPRFYSLVSPWTFLLRIEPTGCTHD